MVIGSFARVVGSPVLSRILGRFPGPTADPSLHYLIGAALLLALAGLFVWRAPLAHGPAAAALTASLALDAASRLATAAVARRAGVAVVLGGLPSLVLPLGGTPLAACLALLCALGAFRFPVAASLIAGVTAMGALARLALARSVLVHAPVPAAAETLTPP